MSIQENNEEQSTNYKYLFRFRPSTQYAIEAVLRNETYAVSPNFLNDYDDCKIHYDIEKLWKKLSLSKKYREYVIDNLFVNKSKKQIDFNTYEEYIKYEDQEFEKAVSVFLLPKSKEKILSFVNKQALEAICSFRKAFSIVSFSISYLCQVMWSHYCSDSSGFVLVYEKENIESFVRKLIEEKFSYFADVQKNIFGLKRIVYTNSMIDCTDYLYKLMMYEISDKAQYYDYDYIKNIKTIDEAKMVLSMLTTKKEEWKYENEYRLILPFDKDPLEPFIEMCESRNKRINYFNIGNIKIFGIILGDKISLINEKVLSYYCKDKSIPIWSIDGNEYFSTDLPCLVKID